MAAFLVSRTTRAIRNTTKAINSIAHGDLSPVFPKTGSGEVGELQAAFQQMLTNLKDGHAKIERLAFTDLITELPNRRAFRARLEEIIKCSNSTDFTLVFIDLDGFKRINDMFGHDRGDILLNMVSRRLQTLLNNENTGEQKLAKIAGSFMARLGGDEFGIILHGVKSASVAEFVTQKVLLELCKPFDLQGQKVTIGASACLTQISADDCTSDQLLKRADLAMYSAKCAGRGTVRSYEPKMEQYALERFNS